MRLIAVYPLVRARPFREPEVALVRNAIWNLSGQVLPLAAAILVIPLLLRAMGTEGFGLVTIVWTLIGYFSLFDFGLGRALTKFVSMEIGQQNTRTLPALVVTAMTLLTVLGIATACLIWLSVPWVVANVLKPQVRNLDEVIFAFHLTALTIPIVVINVGLRAILEGLLRFDLVNQIRVPFGLFTIVSPAIVSHFGYGLPVIVLSISGGVLIAMVGYALQLRASARKFHIASGSLRWAVAKKLLSFGGWISISNFVAPMIFHLDRFIISAILSVTVMAYYVTPYEAVTKTLILSSAIAGSLFPVFAKLPREHERSHMAIMLAGAKTVMAIMMPVLMAIACFGYELLELWVGQEVAINGSGPLVFLSAGVFFNAIAYMPYTLLQANGRADLVAKMQLLQVPIYPPLLWFAVSQWRLEGAAIAWAIRAFLEMSLFFAFAKNIGGAQKDRMGMANYTICGLLILVFGLFLGQSPLWLRAGGLAIALPLFFLVLWVRVFSAEDRVWINGRIGLILDRVIGKG